MLTKEMINKLNEQINLEFYSSNVYLQMSAWCDKEGFEGAADFLLRHADEEIQHMQKIFAYLSEAGGMPVLGAIEAPKQDFKSLREVFEVAFAHEELVTKSIDEMVKFSFKQEDFSTFNFLQSLVAEQHEETDLFSTILDKFNVIGEDGRSLYFIDKDLASL